MKDFTMVTPPHWTELFWLVIVMSVIIVVATIFIQKRAGDDGGDLIAFFVRIIFFTVTIPFWLIAVFSHGVWLKSGEYQGEFKVAKAEINNGGFSDRYAVTLSDKNGRQHTFDSNSSVQIKDIEKGDNVILKVEMPFDKKPVWTKSIYKQGGNIISIKKADR